MKYAHIIYNSSEKNRAGGVGFGVRTATEGTSDSLLSLLEQNEIFAFNEAGPEVSSKMLSDDPDAIMRIPPVYFFRSVTLPDRSVAYALGRKMAVGFDYTFYLNGRPGRMGNYVVDTYLFPEAPSAEEFEILLEEAADDSNHFIPVDPAPRPENEEMKTISVGQQADLKPEERSFAAVSRPEITPDTISLLFAFISSYKEGRHVLVKTDVNTPPSMMAGLATLVPQEQIRNLSFITNHCDEGKKQGINIVFINEYYPYEIFRKQWMMLDLSANEQFDSEESRVFRPLVEKFISEDNLPGVRNLTGWCLSDLYDKSKDLSKQTQTALFNYLYNYSAFSLRDLEKDKDLLRLLSDYLKDHPEKKDRLLESLDNEFQAISDMKGLYSWIDFILNIGSIDVSESTSRHKEAITSNVFASPQAFAQFYRRYRQAWGKVAEAFLTPDSFRNHNAFLTSLQREEWEALYPRFLAEFKDNRKYLVKRMLTDHLPADVFEKIRKREIPDKAEYVDILISLLKENPGDNEKRLVALIAEALANDTKLPCDFMTHFEKEAENPLYAALFSLQIEKAPIATVDDVKAIHKMLTFFIRNPYSPNWFNSPKAKTILLSVYNTIKRKVAEKSITRQEADDLTCAFFKKEFPKESVRRFRIFYDALLRKELSDNATTADLWAIAEELGDVEYLCSLAPHQIQAYTVRDPEALHDLVGTFIEKGYITEEELLLLASASKKGGKHILKGIIRHRKGKPNEILAYLTDTLHWEEPDAMAYLEEMFPNTHKKILKSREPSMMEKVGGMFKNLFGGKKKNAEADSEEEKEEKKEERKEERNEQRKEKNSKKKKR